MLASSEFLPPSEQPKVRCFGNSAALTAEGTRLMLKGIPSAETVNLEVAPRHGKNINWARKITIQLSESELPVLAAVCLGYLPDTHLKRPGKGIVVERQSSRLFVSATQGSGNAFALPIPIGQTFQVSSLVLSQLQKQAGLTDGNLLLAALRGAASLYRSNS